MSDHAPSERVRTEPHKGRVVVRIGAATVVDTTRAVAVHEQGHPVRYYVPRADVRAELRATSGAACPWKGRWHHLDVAAGDKTIPAAAWEYYEPTPACESIRDHVAFYPERVDAFELR